MTDKEINIEKLAYDATLKLLTNKKGEFIRSTIGADDFKNGIIYGYKMALQNKMINNKSKEILN